MYSFISCLKEPLFLLLISLMIAYGFYFLYKHNIYKKYCFIIALTIIYALITFYHLGSLKMPHIPYLNEEKTNLIIKSNGQFDHLLLFTGEADEVNGYQRLGTGYLLIEGSNDNKAYSLIKRISKRDNYMKYLDEPINGYKYLRISFDDCYGAINELGLYDSNTKQFLAYEIIANDPLAIHLNDEQDSLYYDYDYQYENYFDEVYHVRNAYEILNNYHLYTAVHPLLGTRLISLGMHIFGINPFGYRFMGALVSILLNPIFYYFVLAYFKDEKTDIFASILFAADFMHYTTGRIATLEPFSLLFILLMFIFMHKYSTTSYFEKPKKALKYLFLSALMMSFAWSVKWTAIYASLALAIYFFYLFYHDYLDHKDDSKIIRKSIKLFLFCLLFFIIMPITIYYLSYLGIRIDSQKPDSIYSYLKQVSDYIIYAFNYHKNLNSTHPYSSKWYMWLFNIRPIWYYVKYSGDIIQTISCFNNPAINLFGIFALVITIKDLFKKKDLRLLLPLLAYLSLLIPWIFISRTAYSYHYYPCIPFLIMLIAGYFKYHPSKRNIKIAKILIISSVMLMIVFLPVISGFKANNFYATVLLRWLPSWYFGKKI